MKKGYVECMECYGRGYLECSYCNGVGEIQDGDEMVKCPYCDGGQVECR